MSETDNDPLYQLLLEDARRFQGLGGRAVLIEETTNPDDACWCRSPDGAHRRAWLCDASGIHPLSNEEFRAHRDRYDSSEKLPFVMYSFYISPDRETVTLSVIVGALGGHGGGWLVVNGDNGLELKPDPDNPGWIS